jgi:hypothetical protein
LIVLVPFVAGMLDPRTTDLIGEHVPAGVEVRWRELSADQPTGYSRLLTEAWGWPGALVVVEQDIGLVPGVIEGFQDCTQPWCGHPYQIGQSTQVCLGCTRFTAGLKAALPGLMSEAAAVGSEQDGGGVPAGVWQRLDVRIGALLERAGHQRHPHQPEAIHFHEYPMPGR